MAMFLYRYSIYEIMVNYESIGQIFCMLTLNDFDTLSEKSQKLN